MEAPTKLHFLLFPWLAFGHILPFLNLSKCLADAGISITFLCPSSAFPRLPPLHLPHHLSLISFHPFSLPSIPGLPPSSETTFDLPPHLQTHLKTAVDSLQPLLQTLLAKLSPNLVIHDYCSYWLPKMAAKLGIPSVYFSIFNASSLSYFSVPSRWRADITPKDLMSPPPRFPPSALRLHPFEAEAMVGGYIFPEPDIPAIERFIQTISNSDMVIIRSCSEVEGKYIEFLEKEFDIWKQGNGGDGGNGSCRKFLPIGCLSPRSGDKAPIDKNMVTKSWVDWLDRQPNQSVTYVAFGTECVLTPAQTHAIASGLEESGTRFLWIRRFPPYVKSGVTEGLPDGFLDRVQGRGLVFGEWVPQTQVLEHPAVGVFFTHGGASSLVEGLASGRRLVFLPIQIDQGLNARLVAEEWKAAVEVQRTSLEDGSFTGQSVGQAIQRAVSEAEDVETWRNAKHLRARVFTNVEAEEQHLSHFFNRVVMLARGNGDTHKSD
ncbi:hypothetical protein AMTRI_Chr02g212410 [Amborella trichopoda]